MLNDVEKRKVGKAKRLWENNEIDKALDIIKPLMVDHPWDRDLLQLAGVIFEKAGNIPIAYHLFKAGTSVDPEEANNWVNLGRAAEDLWRTDEAEAAYKKALKICKRDETLRILLGNLAAMCIDNARYPEAERWARQALEKFPDFDLAKSNLGFAQLAMRNWAEGWKNYRYCLGTTSRTKFVYKGEPEWDGTPGKRLVLYGEQGIGDEISFASMVPDAIKDCEKVIIDCDLRLATLYARSFPQAIVYGTRKMPHDCVLWTPEDREFDCSLAVGQLGEYYRASAESFTGEPYLVADPDRVLMWKALWKSKAKPVIGIAWQGGIQRTGAKFRRWTLEQLLPVLRSVDAHWVSLEYKPAGTELDAFRAKYPDVDIREYPHATLTNNYDDTAALVASLDMVFCMQTAVAHLGGALGVPTWVCVPPISQWRYGTSGDSIPWYKSLKVIRQRNGKWDFNALGDAIATHLG
jgi:tetratricopeptide (TPR) repeat protein